MLILDKPRQLDGDRLVVPLYHRSHLSLLTGTKVWLCLLPVPHASAHLPELVISPIDASAWPDLWRITCLLKEEGGVLQLLYGALRSANLNVLAAESSAVDRQRWHAVEVIVDARQYSGITDGDTSGRISGAITTMPDLERFLTAVVLDHVAVTQQSIAKLRVRRMNGLCDAWREFQTAQRRYHANEGFAPRIGVSQITLDRTRGIIDIPRELADLIVTNTHAEQREPPKGALVQYLMVSDTKERYLRTFFLAASQRILSATIEHSDRMGAIASITAALHSKGFNILTSLSRLHNHGGRAQFELVVQPPPGPDDTTFRATFEKALAEDPGVRELDLTVSYDQHYRSASREAKPLTPSSVRIGHGQSQAAPAAKHLKDLCKVLEHRLSLPQPLPDDAIRYDIARRLLKDETEVRRLGRPPITLFVSFAFKDKKRFERLVREARQKSIHVVTGKKLGQQRVHRDGIISLIRRSTHFLGIWTEEGALPFKKKYLPSPWLTWELGVAEASGIRTRLLISSQIHDESWKRIYPEVPHTVFEAKEELESVRFVLGLIEGDRTR